MIERQSINNLQHKHAMEESARQQPVCVNMWSYFHWQKVRGLPTSSDLILYYQCQAPVIGQEGRSVKVLRYDENLHDEDGDLAC